MRWRRIRPDRGVFSYGVKPIPEDAKPPVNQLAPPTSTSATQDQSVAPSSSSVPAWAGPPHFDWNDGDAALAWIKQQYSVKKLKVESDGEIRLYVIPRLRLDA